jgi:hypothetical protein
MAVNSFVVFPLRRVGTWQTNDARYREVAHELLAELEQVFKQLNEIWPTVPVTSQSIVREHPEIYRLIRLRDRAADSTQIFAAMAIEGFLNYYGVLRFGQQVFEEHFERLGVVPKLRQLLLICDGINLSKDDPLCDAARRVAESRNQLLHPKAKEVPHDGTFKPTVLKLPEYARESVNAMETFFTLFASAVPNAAGVVNTERIGASDWYPK